MSELHQALTSRAYTPEQVELICQAQSEKYQFSTLLAYAAGLRAHELLTLQRAEERSASTHRTWSAQRFTGREGQRYTVIGKGGLIREVLIPNRFSPTLEARRMAKPHSENRSWHSLSATLRHWRW